MNLHEEETESKLRRKAAAAVGIYARAPERHNVNRKNLKRQPIQLLLSCYHGITSLIGQVQLRIGTLDCAQRHGRLLILPRRRTSLTTWRTHRIALRLLSEAHLLLYVWSIFHVLVEVADVAADVFVGFQRERNQGNEAEGKPLPKMNQSARGLGRVRLMTVPSFVAVSGHVTAVLTLYCQVFGTRKAACECYSWSARLAVSGWSSGGRSGYQ
jgi:hypothetical protein